MYSTPSTSRYTHLISVSFPFVRDTPPNAHTPSAAWHPSIPWPNSHLMYSRLFDKYPFIPFASNIFTHKGGWSTVPNSLSLLLLFSREQPYAFFTLPDVGITLLQKKLRMKALACLVCHYFRTKRRGEEWIESKQWGCSGCSALWTISSVNLSAAGKGKKENRVASCELRGRWEKARRKSAIHGIVRNLCSPLTDRDRPTDHCNDHTMYYVTGYPYQFSPKVDFFFPFLFSFLYSSCYVYVGRVNHCSAISIVATFAFFVHIVPIAWELLGQFQF